MVNRILIGNKNGRMGTWVSRPGVDATGETGRFLFNSDNDYLRLHWVGRVRINSTDIGGGYREWSRTVTWPDLGYRPLVFVTLSDWRTSSNRVVYPYNTPDYGDLQIFSDRLTFKFSETGSSSPIYLYIMVFKQRVE